MVNGLSARRMRRDVEALFSPPRPSGGPDLVGAEIELIPVTEGPNPGAVRLFESVNGAPSLVDLLRDWERSSGEVREERRGPRDVRFRTSSGGWITFEPGGQLEFSSAPRETPAAVLADVVATLDPLCEAAHARGVRLVSRGLNPWHDLEDVPLQLESPRYRAMDAYLRRRGPSGARMMRLTAAMQINLDLGSPEQRTRRWRAANLLSPVIRASFANSRMQLERGSESVSGRTVLWGRTDPSRTGVLLSTGPAADWSPSRDYLDFALAAHVMFRRDDRGDAIAASSELPFGEWWSGSGEAAPDQVDWESHLSTLFPDVRPRGWFELRAIDVPRRPWWAVPLTLLPALLFDDEALSRTLEILEPLAPRVAELANRAGFDGLRVKGVGEAAERVFLEALDAAHRAPPGHFTPGMLATTEEFFRRYISARRTQADDEETESTRSGA